MGGESGSEGSWEVVEEELDHDLGNNDIDAIQAQIESEIFQENKKKEVEGTHEENIDHEEIEGQQVMEQFLENDDDKEIVETDDDKEIVETDDDKEIVETEDKGIKNEEIFENEDEEIFENEDEEIFENEDEEIKNEEIFENEDEGIKNEEIFENEDEGIKNEEISEKNKLKKREHNLENEKRKKKVSFMENHNDDKTTSFLKALTLNHRTVKIVDKSKNVESYMGEFKNFVYRMILCNDQIDKPRFVFYNFEHEGYLTYAIVGHKKYRRRLWRFGTEKEAVRLTYNFSTNCLEFDNIDDAKKENFCDFIFSPIGKYDIVYAEPVLRKNRSGFMKKKGFCKGRRGCFRLLLLLVIAYMFAEWMQGEAPPSPSSPPPPQQQQQQQQSCYNSPSVSNSIPSPPKLFHHVCMENEKCQVFNGGVVRFGNGEHWIYKQVLDGTNFKCNSKFIGRKPLQLEKNKNPLSCQFKQVESMDEKKFDNQFQTLCSEYSHCKVYGPGTLRYGKNGNYVFKEITKPEQLFFCSNYYFGKDPQVGVIKECAFKPNPEFVKKRNLYQILDIESRHAPWNVVKTSYKQKRQQLIAMLHDVKPNQREIVFGELGKIEKAKKYLSQPKRKKEYDIELSREVIQL